MDNDDNLRLPFDAAVCAELRDALVQIGLRHPEVKCFGVAIAWHGNLNDANISHGVWLTATGDTPKSADQILGSLSQTGRLMAEQLHRAELLDRNLRESVTKSAEEMRRLHEQKEAQGSAVPERS